MLAQKIGHRPDWALLITRVAVGLVFIAHGWQKYQGGVEDVSGFLTSVKIPASLAWPLIIIELVGGILILVGIFSRWAALFVSIVMVVAIVTVKFKVGLLGGYELDLVVLAGALSILLTGPGKYSVEKTWFHKELP